MAHRNLNFPSQQAGTYASCQSSETKLSYSSSSTPEIYLLSPAICFHGQFLGPERGFRRSWRMFRRLFPKQFFLILSGLEVPRIFLEVPEFWILWSQEAVCMMGRHWLFWWAPWSKQRLLYSMPWDLRAAVRTRACLMPRTLPWNVEIGVAGRRTPMDSYRLWNGPITVWNQWTLGDPNYSIGCFGCSSFCSWDW